MFEIREYLAPGDCSPFTRFYDRLGPAAASKVTVAMNRLREGNTSNVKSVGKGVLECRIGGHGPGLRVYFGMDGQTLVILLGGGTKKRQDEDIKQARARWQDYKARKRTGEPQHRRTLSWS